MFFVSSSTTRGWGGGGGPRRHCSAKNCEETSNQLDGIYLVPVGLVLLMPDIRVCRGRDKGGGDNGGFRENYCWRFCRLLIGISVCGFLRHFLFGRKLGAKSRIVLFRFIPLLVAVVGQPGLVISFW